MTTDRAPSGPEGSTAVLFYIVNSIDGENLNISFLSLSLCEMCAEFAPAVAEYDPTLPDHVQQEQGDTIEFFTKSR